MIAITGASGHLGLAIIQALVANIAPADVVAVVRDPQKAAGVLPPGVTIRTADYNDAAALVAAFQGVEKVVLVSTNERDFDTRVRQHQRVIDAARQAGVRHVLYTSVLNPSATSAFVASPTHLLAEDYLRASGLMYTIFRNTLYLDSVQTHIGPDTLASGQLAAAAGEGRVSFGLRTEMGEAIANVLTSAGHENQVYQIAPAPAYSFHDIAAMLSKVTGRPVTYTPVAGEAIAAGMRARQAPEFFIGLRLGVSEATQKGEFATTSPTFEQLLGRRPTDLKTYLATVYGK